MGMKYNEALVKIKEYESREFILLGTVKYLRRELNSAMNSIEFLQRDKNELLKRNKKLVARIR